MRSLARALRAIAFRVACLRPVNAILRAAARASGRGVATALGRRLPFVGIVHVRLAAGTGFRMRSDGRDWIASRLGWQGPEGFEPETMRVLLPLARSARVFLDVGASTGVYSLAAASQGSALRVFAFEPLPSSYEGLVRNIRLNGFTHVRAIPAAVTRHEGEVALHVPDGPSLPLAASLRADFRPGGRIVKVAGTSIDRFCSAEGIEGVDLIKIDAEGTEPDVLEGAREVLRRDRPRVVCEVLWRQAEARLATVFAELGYRFFHITSQGLAPVTSIEGDASYEAKNYLFVPE